MISFRAACLAACVFAGPAAAQEYLGIYYAYIGPQDFYNSSGLRIASVCGVLQQDRANLHRFGKGDPQDEVDPYFGERAARGVFGRDCRAAQGEEAQRAIIDAIRAGRPITVPVNVLGRAGRPSAVIYGAIAG